MILGVDMTIRRFIALLKFFPQDAHIGFEWDGSWSKPGKIYHFKDENAVIVDVSSHGTFDEEEMA